MSSATTTPSGSKLDQGKSKTAADTTPKQESIMQKMDGEMRRTLIYVVGAVCALVVTGILAFTNRPAPIKEFGKVGQEFYASFTDPTKATALEVSTIDTDELKPLEFEVKRLENGRWVIPSHHNYPADAEDRLANTAASTIGIKRGALVTRWKSDHARYGVVNPKQDALNVDQVEGVGKRLTLRGEDDSVLVDYIIGKQVEDSTDEYYVRHPQEDDVYVAKLDIDLSTKFTDWIETDLLEVSASDLRKISANDYKFDELTSRVTSSDVTTLQRETSSDGWELVGGSENEEPNDDTVRDLVNEIADLEIVGVRPRQKGLTPDLQLDRTALRGQKDVDRLQSDLLTRGFLLQPGENGDQENLKLLAREGELLAATQDGVEYHLYFGRVFTGSQDELETGFASNERDNTASKTSTESSDGSNADSSDEGETTTGEATNAENGDDNQDVSSSEEDQATGKPGRYVFVTARFDEGLLSELPTKPVEPVVPEELKNAEDKKQDSADKDDPKAAENDDQASTEAASSDNEAADSEEKSGSQEEDVIAKLRKEYEDAKQKYEDDLKAYENKLNSRNEKIEKGKKKADDLRRRFAQWYYVVSGDSVDKLKLARADLVNEKEPEATKADESAETKSVSDADSKASSDGTENATSGETENPPKPDTADKGGGDAQPEQPSKPTDE